jgi:hypothetical protein
MGALADILEAVKAMRTIATESPEELGSRLEDVASELLFAVAEALIDENGFDGAMSILHSLSDEPDYDKFIVAVIAYRRPIIGDDEPDDWEYPYYAMLLLTEPVTIKEEACDER